VLKTIVKVATIYPQKWRLGKILFVVLRYFPFMIIAIDLSSTPYFPSDQIIDH
jgi:hypothetical protein